MPLRNSQYLVKLCNDLIDVVIRIDVVLRIEFCNAIIFISLEQGGNRPNSSFEAL